jgi:hypothetical protein
VKARLLAAGLAAISAMTWLGRRGRKPAEPLPDTTAPPPELGPRERVVAIALGELGQQNPDRYWSDVQPRLEGTQAAWCGGFALWVLRQAGLTDWPWEVGKGFCYRLPTTRAPQPGDIAYFRELQHHAIVESVDAQHVHTIDGNQRGETVARRSRPRSDVAAFYSIEPLLLGEAVA